MRGKSELTFNPAKISKQSAAAQTGASGADNAEGTERATNGLDRDTSRSGAMASMKPSPS